MLPRSVVLGRQYNKTDHCRFLSAVKIVVSRLHGCDSVEQTPFSDNALPNTKITERYRILLYFFSLFLFRMRCYNTSSVYCRELAPGTTVKQATRSVATTINKLRKLNMYKLIYTYFVFAHMFDTYIT